MAQAQLSVTFNVSNPAPPPLVFTPPSTMLNLTVGVAADGTAVATLSGGAQPYTFALDANSGPLPTGITFAEDGNGNVTLAGTPTAAGTSTVPVLLDGIDANGATASLKLNAITAKK